MIAVIQRVINANVKINNSEQRTINHGLVILLGINKDDTEKDSASLVDKIISLRIFNDRDNKMNNSLLDVNGSVLIISQFTLCGNIYKGRRPSFLNAANPKYGLVLYNDFVKLFKQKGIDVETGEFGAHMDVTIINNGPATFVIDSNNL